MRRPFRDVDKFVAFLFREFGKLFLVNLVDLAVESEICIDDYGTPTPPIIRRWRREIFLI